MNRYLEVSGGGERTVALEVDVVVSVTNKDEFGALGLSSPQPQADVDFTSTLSDPDGVVSTAWTCSARRAENSPWTAVSGVTSSVYEVQSVRYGDGLSELGRTCPAP